MIIRAFVAFGCYLLSSFGIIASVIIALFALLGQHRHHHSASDIIYLFIFYAWIAHAVMTLAWVENRKVSRWWVISGTLAGVVGVSILSVAALMDTKLILIKKLLEKDMYGGMLLIGQSFFFGVILSLVFVFPCVLLAIHLLWFHWAKSSQHGQDEAR